MPKVSKNARQSVAVTAVVVALLLLGGYGFITWYGVSRLEFPLSSALRFERPWVLASVLLAGAATLALDRGYTRISLGLAACAIAGPFAAGSDFISSFSPIVG